MRRHKLPNQGQTDSVHSRNRIRYRRLKIVVVLAVLLLAGSLFMVWQLTQPVHGHRTHSGLKLQAARPAETPQKQLAAQTVQDAYFDLPLPAGYSLPANAGPPAGLLYQQTILKPSDFGSLVLNVAIKNLPEGGLAAEPAYQLRSQQAGRYGLSTELEHGDRLQIAGDRQSAAMLLRTHP